MPRPTLECGRYMDAPQLTIGDVVSSLWTGVILVARQPAGAEADVSERLTISVTFDPQRGYVTAGGELPPLMALSLSGLRRKLEDRPR
jgi:hypothetical protein